jgi:hypothetical protein
MLFTFLLDGAAFEICVYSIVFVFHLIYKKLIFLVISNWPNIYIDSIEKIWQKSLVRINFHWPCRTTAKVDEWIIVKYCKFFFITYSTVLYSIDVYNAK